MLSFTLYADPISGNCLKVKWVADLLGIAVDWRTTDVRDGDTRTPDFLGVNPDGRVPFAVFADGRRLAESNAIIAYLAEGSHLVPSDPFARAKMLQWMFWEQYSHEPYIAVRRFHLTYLDKPEEALDPRLLERGNHALGIMERQLGTTPYFVGDDVSLADVALVAYTRMAHEGGFSLEPYPSVRGWIARVEKELRIPH